MEDDLYCWGSLRGGASNDTAEAIGPKPKLAGAPGMKWKTISGGMQHACGLLQDDTARCFGLGWHGQVGGPAAVSRLISPWLIHSAFGVLFV
jgi:hypothetical protein